MKKIGFISLAIIFLVNISFSQTLRDRIKERKEQQSSDKTQTADLAAPDYSDLYYWAANPAKWDYSDSIPSFLKNEIRDSSVDVFFLHPTTFTKNFKTAAMNADVNDPGINHATDAGTILYQASVFNGSSRVFAPRYRQAHLKAF